MWGSRRWTTSLPTRSSPETRSIAKGYIPQVSVLHSASAPGWGRAGRTYRFPRGYSRVRKTGGPSSRETGGTDHQRSAGEGDSPFLRDSRGRLSPRPDGVRPPARGRVRLGGARVDRGDSGGVQRPDEGCRGPGAVGEGSRSGKPRRRGRQRPFRAGAGRLPVRVRLLDGDPGRPRAALRPRGAVRLGNQVQRHLEPRGGPGDAAGGLVPGPRRPPRTCASRPAFRPRRRGLRGTAAAPDGQCRQPCACGFH